jgi:hypothetical protein
MNALAQDDDAGSTPPATGAPPLRAREAALAFMDGTRTGWRATHLSTWCKKLKDGGHLTPWDAPGGKLLVTEGNVRQELSLDGSVAVLDLPSTKQLITTARERVLAGIGTLLTTPPDDRFVRAAVYAGRARRMTLGGASTWVPVLREGELLSQWVLALFAVDALAHREVYDELLGVCEMCGAVSLRVAGQRRRCHQHAGNHPSGRIPLRLGLSPIPADGVLASFARSRALRARRSRWLRLRATKPDLARNTRRPPPPAAHPAFGRAPEDRRPAPRRRNPKANSLGINCSGGGAQAAAAHAHPVQSASTLVVDIRTRGATRQPGN